MYNSHPVTTNEPTSSLCFEISTHPPKFVMNGGLLKTLLFVFGVDVEDCIDDEGADTTAGIVSVVFLCNSFCGLACQFSFLRFPLLRDDDDDADDVVRC